MALNSTVFLADTELRVSETAGSVTQRILRTGSLDDEATITYGITGDTAGAGQDFVGGFGTVTIPAGADEISVAIPLLNDTQGEATELFVFSLVSVEGADLGVPRTSRISILDDETPAPPPGSEPPLASDYTVTQNPVLEGLNQPIKFEFSPLDPSRAYVAEKGGIIRVADTTAGTSSVMLDIRGRVNESQDRGLLDIALHPDFTSNPYIYAFFTVDPSGAASLTGNAGQDGGGNRYSQVSRFTADTATGYTTVVPGSEVVLLGAAGRSLNDISGGGRQDFTDPDFAAAVSSERYADPGAPAQTVIGGFKQDYLKADAITHVGGGLIFGPDGALYVSTGDGTSPNFADPRAVDVLSLDSLSGKILRIDPITGRGLADNPFAEDGVALTSNRAKVFQSGLRNPFSVAFDDEGRLFITNTGWNSYEAIFAGGPGANFGWPFYEGGDGGVLLQTPNYRNLLSAAAFYNAVASGDTVVTAPFRAFSHNSLDPGFQVQGITGGSMVYGGDRYPAAFQDDFFFTDFAGGEVYTVDAKDRTELKFLYRTEGGAFGPIDYVQGPDGYIYYVDLITGEIGRYDIVDGAPPPPPPPRTPAEITIGSGPDSLVLRISQDEYAGDAQYTVSVDGAQVNGTLTAAAARVSGLFDTVTVLGTWAPGGHTATINFLNDAYGGANGLDRNLFLNGASYNGTDILDLQVGLTAAGPASFGFTDTGGTPPPSGSITTIGSGQDTLVLRITQDAYQGSAQYTVSVDGVQVGAVLTASALRGSGQSDTVNVLGTWGPGSHAVSVNFLNDAWGGSAATDRNLYLESATYNGAAVPGATAVFEVDGPRGFAFTDTGTAPPPPSGGATTMVGSGPDTLVLRITQDAYQGDAQYTISVDGVQVGGVLSASAPRGSGQSDTVNVLGDFAAGSHTVSINFLNDAWGGTAATDRNLYLEGATYNGAAVAGATAVFDTGGARDFGFVEGGAPPPPPPGGGSNTATIGTGPDMLALRVSQDAYQGSAQYTVSVDGALIGGVQTATALRGGGQSDTVNVLGDFSPGGHTVTVNFLNDAYGGTAATDRNLYVEGATYNGGAVSGAERTLFAAGPASFGFTEAAGTAPPPASGGATATIGTGSDALVLRIAQDAYQGSAQYTVSVDGVRIGGVLTAQALQGGGQADTVTVRGDWAPGSHSASITFLNDAWDGTAATDRNLYLQGATYNGAAVTGATAVFEVEGPRGFGFTDTSPIG